MSRKLTWNERTEAREKVLRFGGDFGLEQVIAATKLGETSARRILDGLVADRKIEVLPDKATGHRPAKQWRVKR